MSAGARDLLDNPRRPRVLLVGDMILDRYQHGSTRRISPEAPIPVLEATRQELRLGGCGNVAANLAALGADVSCVCLVGDDRAAEHIARLLEEAGCRVDGLVVDADRPTIRKTRIVAQNQQLLRIDEERVGPPSEAVEADLLARVEAHIAEVDIVVVSDYGKGALSDGVLERLLRAPNRPRVLVDPKGRDYGRYSGASLITPNRLEAETALGRALSGIDAVRSGAEELCTSLGLEAVLITLGSAGMFCRVADSSREISVPARARAVYDVTGAGDTVIAVLAWSLAQGADLELAMQLSTVAAGLTVQRFGVAAITREEIHAALSEADGPGAKVLGREALLERLAGERERGRRVVFTNGCFDVLHVGHLAYLQEARSYGDVLVLGVNDDASVRRLKGDPRPVNRCEDRMALLAGLECVTFVTSFSEDTPEQIVRDITPQVLVKGEDWADKGVVGREWVEAHGGHVVLASVKQGYSTTNTLARLNQPAKD